MIVSYPFSAIVGQDKLKTALMLCAVNPGAGLLIAGDKGTAKSTAARGLSEVLPPVEAVSGCPFNCSPGQAHELCDICRREQAQVELLPVPFVNLPLGATEDRVLGSLDFERALKEGKRAFQPGLLASVHRGILYIDEVNLLADHLVDVLLDTAATGVNIIQREGLSISHPARFSLIGTMNPEEGDLRPQLLDRFGMMVQIAAPRDAGQRAEVVCRRLEFEADPLSFAEKWASKQDELRHQIISAQNLLPAVTMDENLVIFISRLCCEMNIASLRADIVINKIARSLAALAGREAVSLEDVHTAAELALPHRRRCKPTDRAGLDRDQLDDLFNKASDAPGDKQKGGSQAQHPEPGDRGNDQANAGPIEDRQSEAANPQPDMAQHQDYEPVVFGTGSEDVSWRLKLRSGAAINSAGRRTIAAGSERGQYVRAEIAENPSNLALDATLRHSVLRNAGKLKVERVDLHQKVKVARHGNTILLVVDSSGSMAALKRMEAVKGAVISLLNDAYQYRDKVGVIACHGQESQLLLPPTRSVTAAEEKLRTLPTGGRTPLAHALLLAAQTIAAESRGESRAPLLVVLSDGRANVGLEDAGNDIISGSDGCAGIASANAGMANFSQASRGDPWAQSLLAASHLAELGVPALVVDTEAGALRFGKARELSLALRAEYVSLDNLSAETLSLSIRRRLRGKRQ